MAAGAASTSPAASASEPGPVDSEPGPADTAGVTKAPTDLPAAAVTVAVMSDEPLSSQGAAAYLRTRAVARALRNGIL
jgi:hypothetical protein